MEYLNCKPNMLGYSLLQKGISSTLTSLHWSAYPVNRQIPPTIATSLPQIGF